MTSLQVSNVQAELDIIIETIDIFRSANYYPTTYNDLIARYIEIVTEVG